MKSGKTVYDYIQNAEELWDFQLNKPFTPKDVPARSNKKFYWKCKNGHPSYPCSPDKKIFNKCGCPICSNHKVVYGINDFESNYPILMLDWDYSKNTGIDPKTLSKRSTTTVFWKCHICGNEWSSRIREATKKEINCPICSKKNQGHKRHLRAIEENGGLKNPELLKDWDYESNGNPSDYSPQANVKVNWICHVCGHRWKAKINNRSNGRGCPCCSHRVLVKGKNDLLTLDPKLAKEWHPTKNGDLTPSDVMPGSGKKVWWICPNGHEYEATPNKRTSGQGTNCPQCNSGRQTSFREQALFYYIKKMYPMTLSRFKPEEFGKFEVDIFIPELNIAVEYDGGAWHKENKYEREQRKYEMCKALGIKLIRVKEKMPKTLELVLADEIISFDDFESNEGFTFVIHSVLDRLDYSDFYRLHPMDVDIYRDRFEIMKYATEIKNSFAKLHPQIAKEWHPVKNGTLKPTMFKPQSTFEAWWLCPKCGNEYVAPIGRRSSGSGCKKCYLERIKTECPNNVAILQYSLGGKFIKEWRSISFASRELKIAASNISKCAKNKISHAGGFRWKYKNGNTK